MKLRNLRWVCAARTAIAPALWSGGVLVTPRVGGCGWAWLIGPRWRGGGGGEALGGEGQFDAAAGVALITRCALQATVVVQVTGAGRAHAVQLSMGELSTFHIHLDLLCTSTTRGRESEQRDGKKRL